jgi:hypothetical protein
MFYYPSAEEGLAWLEASDAAWAARAVAAYDDAVRRQDEPPEEGVT